MNGFEIGDAVERECFDRALAHIQLSLDLLATARAYGASLNDARDGAYKAACILRSTTGFAGSCADEDAKDGSAPMSMKVYPAGLDGTYRWHCYSCKRGGCVVDLIMHAEGWQTNEGTRTSLRALRHAAKLAGCEYLLDDRKPDRRDVPQPELLTSIDVGEVREKQAQPVDAELAFGLNFFAAKHWIGELRGPDGEAACEYLRGRGVTDEQAVRYGLGWARDKWNRLASQVGKGHHPLAVRLGLLRMSQRQTICDHQRDRVVAPYMEPAAEGFVVTGFAGRTLGTDKRKWLHGNNTPGVWEKSSALLGLYQAQDRARETRHVVVCEGLWDLLAFDRLGFAAVSPVGTVMTAEHARIIAELGVRRVTLGLDGDEAGRRAAAGWIAALAGQGIADIDVVDCDDGDDPATTEPALLRERTKRPTSAVDFLHARGLEMPRIVSAERLALVALEQRLTAEIGEQERQGLSNNFASHAEFKQWFGRVASMRVELAATRKQLGEST